MPLYTPCLIFTCRKDFRTCISLTGHRRHRRTATNEHSISILLSLLKEVFGSSPFSLTFLVGFIFFLAKKQNDIVLSNGRFYTV